MKRSLVKNIISQTKIGQRCHHVARRPLASTLSAAGSGNEHHYPQKDIISSIYDRTTEAPPSRILLHKSSLTVRCTSSSSVSLSKVSSSIPLSPFEESSTPLQESKNSPIRSSTSKSPDQVWLDLSHRLLDAKSIVTIDDEQNLKECIRWWSRQRPITHESQEKCWSLWKLWKDNFSKNTTDTRDLWLTVADHWRLALAHGVQCQTTYQEILQHIHSLDQSGRSNIIKSYGILLDGLSKLGLPEEAERILASLQKDGSEPGIILWNTVLNAWAKSQRSDAADRVFALLRRMEHLLIEPNDISYACTLEAIAQSDEVNPHKDTERKMEEIFHRARHEEKESESLWMHRLQWWAKTDKEKAKSLLYSLRNDYLTAIQETDHKDIQCVPNHQIFAVVMSAFAHAGDLDTVRELWNELHDLDERFKRMKRNDEQSPFYPSPAALNTILQSFGHSKVPDRAEKAQALLEAALEQFTDIVDRTSFNTVLDVWAGSSNRQNIEAVRALIDYMQQSRPEWMPDIYTLNALLKALSRSNRRDALHESRLVLKNMWKAYRSGNNLLKPNHVSYSTVLYAHSRLANQDDVKEAERIFEELWNEYYRQNDPELLPSEASYVSLITTWIRSKRGEAASRAAYYFDHMRAKFLQTKNPRFQPSSRIYNTLIDSMKIPGDGEGAETVLRRMINDYRNGNKKAAPTTVTFNTVMTTWLKSRDRKTPTRIENILRDMERLAQSEGWDCRPNTRTFTIVLEAWSALRSVRGAERAEAIFRSLQQHYLKTGDESMRPCNHCFTTVMNAWARSGSPVAPEQTQQLFDEMLSRFEAGDNSLKPSAVTYIALLTAWSRSISPNAPSHVLSILNEMADRHRLDPERYEKPDSWHYSAVINAFAEQGDVKNAEAIFDRVLRNRDGVRPNRGCWNGLFKAYARSGLKDAPERATELLEMMYVQSKQGFGEASPDAVIYTTLLEVWRSSGRDDSFEKGFDLFRDMLEEAKTRKRLEPDAGVFLVLFRMLQQSRMVDKKEYTNRLIRFMEEYKIRPSKAIHQAIADCRSDI